VQGKFKHLPQKESSLYMCYNEREHA
jgi:hypothetical protein